MRLDMGVGIGKSARDDAVRSVAEFLFSEPLVSVDWEGRVSPRLAESWQWLDENRTLQIHLRPNVTFHDGSPLTATLVADVLRQWAEHAAQAEFVRSIEAPDPLTVVIRVSRPDALLLESFDFSMVPPGRPDVGTGAFRLVSRDPLTLQAYETHYRGRPSIDEIRIHAYDTQRGAWAAMMRGEVDYLHEVTREAAEFVEAESSVNTYPYLAAYYIPIVFNMRHPILKNVEVRRALSQAIDRQAIVAQAMHGRAIVADGPIWPQFWAISAAQRAYAYNPEAARVRLDAAGFPLATGGDPTHMSRRFKFTCAYWSDGPQYERIALVVQKQLFEIGVDVDMQPLPFKEIRRAVTSGKYDAFMLQLSSGRALGWTYQFWHTLPTPGQHPQTYYTSADPILDRLRLATSDDDTRQEVAELQRVLFDDPPAVFLVWLMNARAVSTRFEVPTEPNRDIISNLWQWRQVAAAAHAR